MDLIRPKHIRDSLIVERAASGLGVSAIADELHIGQSTVYRTLESEQGQAKLRDTLEAIEARINHELPELLALSLKSLKSVLEAPMANRSEKIAASKVIINTALRLSEIARPKT